MTIFLSSTDIDFINFINEELIEDVIGQTVIIYRVHPQDSKYDELYNESVSKAYYPGFQINTLINFLEPEIASEQQALSQRRRIELYIQRKHLTDNNYYFEEGDLVYWDNQYFEITKITEPQLLQGLSANKHGVRVECISADISEVTIIEPPM